MLFFKSVTGSYHYGIPFDDFDVALFVALEYRNVAPQIMITDAGDCSVFEMENGTLLHPHVEEAANINHPEERSIPETENEFLALISAQLDSDDEVEIENIEHKLLAAAARGNINLHQLGWKRIGDWNDLE